MRGGDAALSVVDLAGGDLLDMAEAAVARLADQNLFLGAMPNDQRDAIGVVSRRTLVAANKCDASGASDGFWMFRELFGDRVDVVPVSATTGADSSGHGTHSRAAPPGGSGAVRRVHRGVA